MLIASVGRALPAHRFDQGAILAFLERSWADRPQLAARLRSLAANAGVETRHLALPLEEYSRLEGFGSRNDVWIEAARTLGSAALLDALGRAGLTPDDVDALFTVSVTGIASPSLDALLMNELPLRTDLKRVPIFGLGCVAGVAGIARAADYLRAFPDQVAVLLAVEICSVSFQPDDHSVAHLVSCALFGDGAAAVVMVGAERAASMSLGGPRVLATRSTFYRDTLDVMGWHITDGGFEIVLSASVPEVARTRLGEDVDRFLAAQGLDRGDIGVWVCHPGGPKVLRAMQDALGLDDQTVAHSWQSLRNEGNLSSASVLMALRGRLDEPPPSPGTRGLLIAMGPGFCSELVLVTW